MNLNINISIIKVKRPIEIVIYETTKMTNDREVQKYVHINFKTNDGFIECEYCTFLKIFSLVVFVFFSNHQNEGVKRLPYDKAKSLVVLSPKQDYKLLNNMEGG